MIGRVIFRIANRRQTAELHDDLTWRCDLPEIQRMLDENFPPYRVPGEDDDTLGRHMLYRAAYRLSGEVRTSRRQPLGV